MYYDVMYYDVMYLYYCPGPFCLLWLESPLPESFWAQVELQWSRCGEVGEVHQQEWPVRDTYSVQLLAHKCMMCVHTRPWCMASAAAAEMAVLLLLYCIYNIYACRLTFLWVFFVFYCIIIIRAFTYEIILILESFKIPMRKSLYPIHFQFYCRQIRRPCRTHTWDPLVWSGWPQTLRPSLLSFVLVHVQIPCSDLKQIIIHSKLIQNILLCSLIKYIHMYPKLNGSPVLNMRE